MALPPIISNLPLFKVAKTDGANESSKTDAPQAGTSSSPQDVVEISEAAAARLEEAQALADEQEALKVAASVRSEIAENPVSLGLAPDFAD